MKQIGSRQESSRLGGIGSCGRELCCSTWMKDFRSVTTKAARYQQLSLNPQKLAGQCGKLKCCLNYELDSYLQELKKFPDFKLKLISEEGIWIFQKADIFSNKLYYYMEGNFNSQIELDLKMVNEIITSNKHGINISISSVLKTKKNQNQVEIHDKIDRFDNIQI
jgi:cell fate regulator YaaT (PSP1 superfamily)